MKLQDKVALVTGASRGIGRAVALRLAAEGAAVAVNYSSSAKEADEVVEIIRKNGGKAVAVKCAVNDSAQVKAMFATVAAELGAVDILVNNAGITKDGLLMKMSDDDFDAVIDTNLKGVFYCMREAVNMMRKKKYGKIINMSSVVGFSGNIAQINYVASKSAVHGMTKAVAIEYGTRGIRVNTVAPGFIKTEMTASLKDDIIQAMLDKTTLKSLGEVEDVASAVLFLAGADSDYITGQVIHVNGGMYL